MGLDWFWVKIPVGWIGLVLRTRVVWRGCVWSIPFKHNLVWYGFDPVVGPLAALYVGQLNERYNDV